MPSSAGVVCVMVDPMCFGIYFLLGQNKRVDSWREGSLRWGDFGGVAHSFESCAATVAAREWLEETLACVKLHAWDCPPHMDSRQFAKELRDEQFLFRVQGVGGSCLFVRQVPWDPTVADRFANTRRTLTRIQQDRVLTATERSHVARHPALSVVGRRRVFHDTKHKQLRWQRHRRDTAVFPEFLEKQRVRLWSLPQIKHAIDNDGVLDAPSGERLKTECIPSFAAIVKELQIHVPHLSY